MRLNELLLRPFGGAREAVPARSPAVLARAERRRRSRRWSLLASADFRRLWMIGIVAFAVRWLEMLVVGVFVYQHTGSAFDVALMTMLRMLPMALFGAVIGAWVERIERRIALIAVVLIMLATSVCLAVLAYLGELAVWHLALASFVNGIAWAADNPVRRVMIGEVVGPAQMGAAMSIDVGANNASRMLGPTIGALLLAFFARPVHYTRLYIGGVVGYLVMLIVFALAPSVPLAGAALLLTGLTGSAFSVMQATLIYLAAPAEMRSRMYGVLSVCIGVGPLGFLGLGLLAEAIGAPLATALSGVAGLAALVAARRWWGRLALPL